MKKKLIRRIRICLLILLVLLLGLTGIVYYAYQHTFVISPYISEKIKNYTRAYHKIDFKFDYAEFNVSKHTINIIGLEAMLPDESPFIRGEKVDIYLASGTGILDYFYAKAVIEKVVIKTVTFDTTAPRPENKDRFENPVKVIPASEIKINGLNLKTETLGFDFPDFALTFIKGENEADLSAQIQQGPFGGNGKLKAILALNDEDSRVNFSWNHDKLALFTPLMLLQHYYEMSVSDGRIDINLDWTGNLSTRIRDLFKDIPALLNTELKGSVNIDVEKFSWLDLNGSLLLNAEKKENSPWVVKFKNKNKSSAIHVDASWQGDKESLADFSADLRVDNLKLSEKTFTFMGIDAPELEPGIINLMGKIKAEQMSIQGSGSAKLKNWKHYGKALELADFNWFVDKGQVLHLKGNLLFDLGKAQASASIDLSPETLGKGNLEGKIQNFDLNSLRPFVVSPVSGNCNGLVEVDFDLKNMAGLNYNLNVEMKNAGFYDFAPDIVTAKIFGDLKNWNIIDPVASFDNGGKIQIKGIVSSKEIDAKVLIHMVDLASFGLSDKIISGKASLDAQATGTIEKPLLEGDLWGDNIVIFKKKFKSFRSRISLDAQKLDLSPMVLRPTTDGMIDGYYSFDFEKGSTRSLKFNLQNLDLELVNNFLPEEYKQLDLKGKIAGSVSFDTQQEENIWDLFLDGRNLSVYDQDIDTLFFEGSLYGNQGEVRNFFVRAFGGKLHLNGQILGADKFDGSIEAESIFLNRIKILEDVLPGARGKLDFHGNIEWEGQTRKGYFTLFGDKIRAKDRDLGNLGAEIVIDNNGMKIIKAEFDRLGVKLDGNIDWKGRMPYQADLRLEDVDLSFFTRAHGFREIDYGGLIVDGQCTVAGDIASLTPDVIEMQLDSIKIQKDNDVIVANRPMQLKYQNNNLEIRSLELKYRQGVLGIEGIYKHEEEAALVLSGKDFSLRALGRLLDLPKWPYEGNLSVEASLFGNYPDYKIRAEAKIDELEIADRKIPGIIAKISGDTRELELENFEVKLPSNSFNLKGKVDLQDLTQVKNIDLQMSIPRGGINDLPELLPDVFREASGTVEGKLFLRGNTDSPEITGELNMEADKLGISGMRQPFKDVVFAVSTNDQIINIDQLSGKLGRGIIQGEGKINFRDGPGSITANITGKNIDFSFLNFEINKASASFDIGGNLYNPEIMGNVYVPRGKLLINMDLLKDRPGLDLFFNSLKYKINVDVPRNFWLRSSFLNAEMRGKFTLMGDLEKFHLDGGVSTVQGWLYFQRRKFRLDTGEIKFGGVENAFDPHIYLKSEGRIQNTQVYLTLEGRISSFTPRIYSSPPMSEGDLLALLTLGRDVSTAMQSDTRDLFEDEILEGLKNSYISALISNTLSTALNLDELFLTSLYDKTEGRSRSYIRAGKYIANNIFMAYEGTLDETEKETYIFEYRLPKGFVVNLEFEKPEKDTRLGIRYDWKFW
jgi:hypothetical protein